LRQPPARLFGPPRVLLHRFPAGEAAGSYYGVDGGFGFDRRGRLREAEADGGGQDEKDAGHA